MVTKIPNINTLTYIFKCSFIMLDQIYFDRYEISQIPTDKIQWITSNLSRRCLDSLYSWQEFHTTTPKKKLLPIWNTGELPVKKKNNDLDKTWSNSNWGRLGCNTKQFLKGKVFFFFFFSETQNQILGLPFTWGVFEWRQSPRCMGNTAGEYHDTLDYLLTNITEMQSTYTISPKAKDIDRQNKPHAVETVNLQN